MPSSWLEEMDILLLTKTFTFRKSSLDVPNFAAFIYLECSRNSPTHLYLNCLDKHIGTHKYYLICLHINATVASVAMRRQILIVLIITKAPYFAKLFYYNLANEFSIIVG